MIYLQRNQENYWQEIACRRYSHYMDIYKLQTVLNVHTYVVRAFRLVYYRLPPNLGCSLSSYFGSKSGCGLVLRVLEKDVWLLRF